MAVGPDGINKRVLRELANELADPLFLFYNLSLQSSKAPDQTIGKKHASVRFPTVVILY